VTLESLVTSDFGSLPSRSAVWRSSNGSVVLSAENGTWNIPSSWAAGVTDLTVNVSATYYVSGTDSVSVIVSGGANVTATGPLTPQGQTAIIECRVVDSVSGAGISGYLVNFTRGSLLGSNTTNASGSAVYSDDVSALSDGSYSYVCDIGDAPALSIVAVDASDSVLVDVDNTFPTITVESPLNASYDNDTVDLNFTVFDANLDSCWYDLNGNVSDLSGCSNATIGPLSDGSYTLTVFVNDTAGNVNSSIVGFTIAVAGDLIAESVVFDPVGALEGESVDVIVNVSRVGSAVNGVVVNLSIEEYNGSWVVVDVLNDSVSISADSSDVVVFSWTSQLGRYRFVAQVDPGELLVDSNRSNNNLSEEFSVSSYEVSYGFINMSKFLSNSLSDSYRSWSVSVPSGVVYYADADASYFPFNLRPLNASGDLALADSALGMTYFVDSISEVWDPSGTGLSDSFADLLIAGSLVENVPIVESTAGSSFITGILYDSADGVVYDGNQDLVFVTVINASAPGLYGAYDYEVLLPSRLKHQYGGISLVERTTELN
jgi:hypothetical protein